MNILRSIHGYYRLYQLSDGPRDFLFTSFINGWLHPFRFHGCDACMDSDRKPVLAGLWIRLTRQRWYCKHCEEWEQHRRTCQVTDCNECRLISNVLAHKRRNHVRFWSQADENGRVHL